MGTVCSLAVQPAGGLVFVLGNWALSAVPCRPEAVHSGRRRQPGSVSALTGVNCVTRTTGDRRRCRLHGYEADWFELQGHGRHLDGAFDA